MDNNATDTTGTRLGHWGWGATCQDFDNNGHPDIFHVNGFDSSIQNRPDVETDPAVLFVISLVLVWGLSWILSGVAFTEIDPRTQSPENPDGSPIQVQNLMTGPMIADFLSRMVSIFTGFARTATTRRGCTASSSKQTRP